MPNPVEGPVEVYEDMVEVLLVILNPRRSRHHVLSKDLIQRCLCRSSHAVFQDFISNPSSPTDVSQDFISNPSSPTDVSQDFIFNPSRSSYVVS